MEFETLYLARSTAGHLAVAIVLIVLKDILL